MTGELAELADHLERRGIRALRQLLGRPLSHGPTDVSNTEAARLTETYWILLDLIGDRVQLTAAGYLKPALVERIAERTGLADWWIGKANREDQTYPSPRFAVRRGPWAWSAYARASSRRPLLPRGAAVIRRRYGGTSSGDCLWAPRTSNVKAGWMTLAVVGSGTPPEEWRSEISELLYDLGWRSGYDRSSPPPANSDTLTVLGLLAGAARARWGEVQDIDFAVAATARAVIRHP